MSARHPLAADVAALTKVYLEARFGAGTFTVAAQREFRAGVARVLRWKRAAQSAPSTA